MIMKNKYNIKHRIYLKELLSSSQKSVNLLNLNSLFSKAYYNNQKNDLILLPHLDYCYFGLKSKLNTIYCDNFLIKN